MNRPRLTGRPPKDNQPHPSASRAAEPTAATAAPVVVAATLSAEHMNDALTAGQASHLSPLITDFIHHQTQWWIAYPGGWLRIDDPELTHLLHTQHQRFCGDLYT